MLLRLRHILHPIRSASSLYRKISLGLSQYRAERPFRRIRRGSRDSCWCGGRLRPFDLHHGYGICAKCGCYVVRHPPLPAEMHRLYSFDLYWHARQRLKGHQPIEGRRANDEADGRVDFWMNLIERHGPSSGVAIEVGCAHAVLLDRLGRQGFDCVGVEPDEKTAEWVRRTVGLDVRSGFFPDVDLPQCDLFLALDVVEHSPAPDAFMAAAARLLKPGGIAMIQTPIEIHGLVPPFGDMFDKVFDELEHLFVFSREGMRALCRSAGMTVIAEGSWRLAHEYVILRKDTRTT